MSAENGRKKKRDNFTRSLSAFPVAQAISDTHVVKEKKMGSCDSEWVNTPSIVSLAAVKVQGQREDRYIDG
jgi:hypothetical protein